MASFLTIVKIPFLLIDILWMWITASPPNPPPPAKEQVVSDWKERFLRSLTIPCIWLRTTYYLSGLIEILVILCDWQSGPGATQSILRQLSFNSTIPKISMLPSFVLGNLFTCVGALLRVQCYRSLGKHFTFELSISKSHILIVTGPYAVVRHPSYTGMILTIVGACLNRLGGSWVSESGLWQVPMGQAILIIWITISLAVIASLLLRMPQEDEILSQRFGDEWVAWSKRVPYRLVPWVY
ncbi:hypothetical protein FA15DRAFT_627774 [Coprinopsis marcescibilis]|uniref:Protein-S-isoprenylcysteine O-methyltransferase n=1 Tax=Coprinopsis marcescibilis TaxID=230819 RepID=A0A5C3KF84_COPMA|nr:hypothetical protein FA15DRAFT_627774 [Coprinopsis marcescibilis]